MKQIRIGWSITLRKDAFGNTVFGGCWESDEPTSRAELIRIIDVANKHYGQGSHWLEYRDHMLVA